MTLFSEKVLISTRCISSLMPNLIKKSWTDSKVQSQAFIYDNMYRTPKYTNLTMWYEYPLSFFDNTGCPKVKCAFLINSDRWKYASQMFWYPEMIYFWALKLIFVKCFKCGPRPDVSRPKFNTLIWDTLYILEDVRDRLCVSKYPLSALA